jgi:hypothetical protein
MTSGRRTNSALTSQEKPQSRAQAARKIAAKGTIVDKTGSIARKPLLLRDRVRREHAAILRRGLPRRDGKDLEQ